MVLPMAHTNEQEQTIEAAQALLASKIKEALEQADPAHIVNNPEKTLLLAEALAWCADPRQSHGTPPQRK